VEGYRIELPTERLTANFNDESILELTPDLVGATETQNSGIIGAPVNLTLAHTSDVRPSQVLYELTTHLLMTKWRDSGEDPKLHLFGQPPTRAGPEWSRSRGGDRRMEPARPFASLRSGSRLLHGRFLLLLGRSLELNATAFADRDLLDGFHFASQTRELSRLLIVPAD
jgi:hypothetical protein